MSLITYQLPLQTQDAEQLLQLKMKFMLENTPVLLSLIYWPVAFGYNNSTTHLKYWFLQRIRQKKYKKFQIQWKSELLVQAMSRNLNVTLYTPKIFSLVDKKFIMFWEQWRTWHKENHSHLLYSISTGRCGFKPNETKSFIAGDTTIRAGLWLVARNYKKLTPLKLHLAGEKSKLSPYFNRIKLINSFFTLQDTTPIAFNGCLLSHLPRKRFRYHEYNVKKVSLFVKSFQYR